MKELLAALRLIFNLPATATEQEATAAATAFAKVLGATDAAPVDVRAVLTSQGERITALTSATPDPAKYVPIATMNALRDQIATLTNQSQQGQVDGLITAALSDGRLLPAQETWARDLGKSNFAQLKQYLDTATPIAALRGTQTAGREASGGKEAETTTVEGELAVCRQLGLTPEQYAKTKGGAK